jgi:hypothetical protein
VSVPNPAVNPAPPVLDLTADPITDAAPIKTKQELLATPSIWEPLTRVGLAGGLLALLAIVVVGSGVSIIVAPGNEPAIESYLKLVFTPVLGLVSSVVGFYFGHQAGSSGSS